MKALFSLLFVAFSLTSFSQKDTAYIYTFGGEKDEQGRDIELTADSGFIMVGSTSSFGAGNSDIYLVKVDSNIKYEWSAAIGHEFTEFGHAVKQTSDGGYVVCGYTNSIGNGSYDAYLVRTDSKGKLLWEKTFGGFDWDFAYDLEITSDGGFLIVGETHSLGYGNADAYLIKTDKNGNLLWEKTVGGSGKDIAHALISTNDGNFAFCGENASKNPANKGDAWLVKFDEKGDTLFDVTKKRDEKEILYSLIESTDGAFYITGFTESFHRGNKDVLAMKYSDKGEFLREDHFGGAGLTSGNAEDRGTDMYELPNGELVLAGFSKSFSSDGSSDFYSAKLNKNIFYQFGTTHGSKGADECYSVQYSNGFNFFGSGRSYDAEYADFMLIKTPEIDSLFIISERLEDTLNNSPNALPDEVNNTLSIRRTRNILNVESVASPLDFIELIDVAGKFIAKSENDDKLVQTLVIPNSNFQSIVILRIHFDNGSQAYRKLFLH